MYCVPREIMSGRLFSMPLDTASDLGTRLTIFSFEFLFHYITLSLRFIQDATRPNPLTIHRRMRLYIMRVYNHKL